MASNKRTSEQISYCKLILTLFVAIDVSVSAWLAQHYAMAGALLLTLAWLGVVVFTTIIIALDRQIRRLIESLEDET